MYICDGPSVDQTRVQQGTLQKRSCLPQNDDTRLGELLEGGMREGLQVEFKGAGLEVVRAPELK